MAEHLQKEQHVTKVENKYFDSGHDIDFSKVVSKCHR